jgi:hypothetical protein
VEGSSEIKPVRGRQFQDSRWFRPPPKVRVVPGILGPHPSQATRVAHRGNGEREVTNGAEAGHYPHLLLLAIQSRLMVKIPQSPSPL